MKRREDRGFAGLTFYLIGRDGGWVEVSIVDFLPRSSFDRVAEFDFPRGDGDVDMEEI